MEAITTTQRIRRSNRPIARRRGIETKPTPQRPTQPTPDAFLTQRIEPLISINEHKFENPKQTEEDFFKSLDYLEALYHFKVDFDIRKQPFPHNVALAFWEAKRAVQAHDPEMKLDIYNLTEHGPPNLSTACLVTYYVYDEPATDTYWLSVLPVANRRGKKEHGPRVNLLRSLMSYFDRVAGVQWYNEDSFVYYQHDYWTDQYDYFLDERKRGIRDGEPDEDEQEAKWRSDEVHAARRNGEKTKHWWDSHCDSRQFLKLNRRLTRFTPENVADEQLVELANSVLEFSRKYPNRKIWHSYLDEQLLRQEDDDYMVELWLYLTFNWDNYDFLSEAAIHSANEEWGNTGSVCNPIKAQYFDAPQTQISIDNDFEFEKGFFEIANNMAIYLNNLIETDKKALTYQKNAENNQSV